jgi:hypothetical protein
MPRWLPAALVAISVAGRMREHDTYSESWYPTRVGLPPLRALHDGRFKLIAGAAPESYDLDRDPSEARNVYSDRPAVATAMTRRLSMLGRTSDLDADRVNAVVSRDLRDRLNALGYVSAAVRAGGER